MNVFFTSGAWDDYRFWADTDRETTKRVNALIEDLRPDPGSGIGKPEELKHALSGCWSRRITADHRLVYLIRDGMIVILQARYHY